MARARIPEVSCEFTRIKCVQSFERLWERLHERYGCPELVESSLRDKLAKFPKLGNRDNTKLYELSDILSEIECAMEDPKYANLLSYFNTSSGVLPIACKLPFHIQGKWTMRATKYKNYHKVAFPPFSEFVNFIREMCSMLNDPGLAFSEPPSNSNAHIKDRNQSRTVRVAKTDIAQSEQKSSIAKNSCILHSTSGHSLNQCKSFRYKSLAERRRLLGEHHMCYRCCETDKHIFKNCTVSVKCSDCGSVKHPSALHPKDNSTFSSGNEVKGQSYTAPQHGGESRHVASRNHYVDSQSGVQDQEVQTKCTNICGEHFSGRSCSKTLLVKVYHRDNPEHVRLMYAILDDQSNRTLCRAEFFETMNVTVASDTPYTLVSCGGDVPMQGRRACGFVVSALDDSFQVSLPSALRVQQDS